MTNKNEQQDKIKVWKCEECTAPEPCRKISGPIDFMCINRANQKWTICDKYQITERKPEPATAVQESNMSRAARLAGHLALNSGYNPENYQRPEVVICEFLNMEFGIRSTQIDASVMGINIHEPHHQGNEGHTTAPPADTPPRKRVKIPKMIKSVDAWVKFAIEHCSMNNKEINKDFEGRTAEGFSWCFSDIPKSWLEDIPAEPTGPIETAALVKKFLDDAGYGHPHDIQAFRFGDHMRDIFFTLLEVAVLAEANNELRHAPQQSFEEWNKHEQEHGNKTMITAYEHRNKAWKACLAAHNLPE